MSLIKDYLPVLAVIVGSSLAYLYGKRNNNLSNFNQQAKENLKELLEPMYYNLRDIINIEDSYEREYNLKVWFNKYSPYKVPLHKLADKSLIENFLNLRSQYKNLYTKTSMYQEEIFERKLQHFYRNLEKQYWLTFNSIYQDYRWYNRILNTHFTFRIILEFTKNLKNFSQFLAFISLSTLLLGSYFRLLKRISLSDTNLISTNLMSLATSVLALSIIFITICELAIPGKPTTLVDRITKKVSKIRKNISVFLCERKLAP
ncbi:hypothetical protein [Priestia megaterium]|uniref:hypothetical protein n=1 Tax=Priestia megaterium TaxID=1404 RepID=UPI001DA7D9A8|nr:hypothetical protein [Priestia megaterium]CAH0318073.1 hypothetical protein SRABI82_05295 [Priestia megaterium]